MGGGSSPTSQTTTSQLSPAMQAMVNQTYSYANGLAHNLPGQYGGQMVAPLNLQEEMGADNMFATGQNQVGQSAISQGVTNAANAGNYQPSQVNSQNFTGGNVQQYMNPYTQNVVNTTNQQLEQNLAQTNQQSDAQATAAGAYGGTRAAVQNAQNNYYGNQVMAQTDAQLNDQAYSNAESQFNTSNAANMQAQQANQSAGIQAANLGLGSADLLGQLGTQQGTLGLNESQAQMEAGAMYQNQQQNQDQWNYQNTYYQPEVTYPQMGLSDLEGAVSGMPYGSTSTASQSNYSNPAMGALGGAASGAEIGSMFGPWGTAIGAVGGGLMGAFG
jgi:hypothetical protein